MGEEGEFEVLDAAGARGVMLSTTVSFFGFGFGFGDGIGTEKIRVYLWDKMDMDGLALVEKFRTLWLFEDIVLFLECN